MMEKKHEKSNETRWDPERQRYTQSGDGIIDDRQTHRDMANDSGTIPDETARKEDGSLTQDVDPT